jgi:predicted component of viral defense system (DUF524 family)
MRIYKPKIDIPLASIQEGLELTIYEEYKKTLFEIEETEASENGEATIQILEGRNYEYKFSDSKYRLGCVIKGLVSHSNRDKSSGRIMPNIYVGTLVLSIFNIEDKSFEDKIYLEVLSTKMNSKIDKSYRENYRFMLENITAKCTELLMQISSPVNQNFEIDFNKDNKTIYQRFVFVQTLINSNEFKEAIQKICAAPTTKWAKDSELKDVRSLRKLNSAAIRQLASTSNRFPLTNGHYLTTHYGLNDIPNKIVSSRKIETVDTPENRFIKHAIEVFLKFCEDCENHFALKNHLCPQKEAQSLIRNLENHLNYPFFKEVSRPTTLRLNSPILQRKSGYREILNSWLKFDLAAKLIWSGGEDVYHAGKRDIAVLYEYWLFFTLYDVIKSKFNLNNHSHNEHPYDHLIVPTNDGLNVMVKSGKHTALEGVYTLDNRKLNIKFSYNRTFSGGKEYDLKVAGSWTKSLRPDYTLSIWPANIKETKAEEQELIVHIHFDSKYKVDQFIIKLDKDPDLETEEKELEEEKTEERKGVYKNADLLKMHAYKDAIRRTGGAYILYPGTENQIPLRGFHEIIPGLGAFAIRPAKDKSGIKELGDFIDSVINHFLDRASQRENISSKAYQIYKESKVDSNILNEPMPEYIGSTKLIPDDNFVLVGYYKTPEHLKWILKKQRYNFRTGTDKGSLALSPKEMGATFLVLHGPKETITDKIYKLKAVGPKIYSKQDLIDKEYPSIPSQDLYIVYEIEKDMSLEFENQKWDIRKLENYDSFWNSANPITVSLKDLLNAKEIV